MQRLSLNTVRLTAVLAAAGAVSGCAVPSPAVRARLNALIGQNEIEVIRERGVPSQTFSTQGHTFLAYGSSYTDIDPGFGGFGGFGGYGGFGGFGYGGFGGFGYPGFGYGGFGYGGPTTINTYTCVLTFEVVQDRVTGWSLKGDGC